MGTTASDKIIRFTAVAVTGLIALSAYTGVVGWLGGGISFWGDDRCATPLRQPDLGRAMSWVGLADGSPRLKADTQRFR
jgi:hypothetical protein